MVQQVDTQSVLAQTVEESIAVKRETLATCGEVIAQVVDLITGALYRGNKVILFGNGGSASDAQHVAGELVGRFLRERAGLPALALTADTAILTCIGNDYGFESIFARQIEAHGKPGDVAVGISTSGNSANVLAAVDAARKLGLSTIGFTGRSGGNLRERVDLCFCVPSTVTARIQETHITIWHVVCDLVERRLFPAAEGKSG